MTRSRWMLVLLLVSWTLNVALGVALFHEHREMRRFFRSQMMDGMPPPGSGLGMLPPEEREAVRNAVRPLVEEQHRLSDEIFTALTQNVLDTVRVKQISDSLGNVRWKMQDVMISHFAALHDRIPPEKREALARKMIGRFEHGPGREHGSWGDRDEH